MIITTHAKQQWINRAEGLGLNTSLQQMERTLAKAQPPKKCSRYASLHLCKRDVLNAKNGATYFKVADGWRFVITNGKCVTVERVKPYENFYR